jgi:hypothetical protein
MELDHETYSHNPIPIVWEILTSEKLLLLFWFERCWQQVRVSSSISYLRIARRSVLLWILWQPKCGSSIERSKFHYKPDMTNKSLIMLLYFWLSTENQTQKYGDFYSLKKRMIPSRVNSIFDILIFSSTFRQNFSLKKEASDLLYMLPSLDPALLSSHCFHLVWYGSCLRWFRVWSPIVSWFCDTLWHQIQKDFEISTFTTFLVQATVKKFHNQDWRQSTETKLIGSSPLWSGIMKPIVI